MSVYAGRKTTGLFDNGCFQELSNRNFTSYNHYTNDSLSNGSSAGVVTFNNYGGTILGTQAVAVDPTKTYQFSVSVKTIQRSYNNRPGSGHLGFACYDQFFNFIDLRHCGGIGNTTLSRPLNAGDSFVYVNSVSGWSTSTTSSFRHLLIFPATHPYYSTPHYYTRIGLGDFNICHATTFTLTAQGDYEVAIQNTSNVNITMPNIGYATPAGTPISVGQAGGSYNYALGAPDYPETWTTYTTPPFTGENRNSSYPFRQATKYINFLNLVNYNYRTETAGNSARYLIDNVLMVQCPNNQALNSSFFNRTSVL
jgi:hypothetical protein